MIDVAKLAFKAGLHSFVIQLRSWLGKKLAQIQAITVALVGLILILSVRIIASFFGRAEAPEIDLRDIER